MKWTTWKESSLPKFRIIASEVTFYRSTVSAASKEAVEQMFEEDNAEHTLGLSEYDGEAMAIVSIEEFD